jgi:hypothetical protein
MESSGTLALGRRGGRTGAHWIGWPIPPARSWSAGSSTGMAAPQDHPTRKLNRLLRTGSHHDSAYRVTGGGVWPDRLRSRGFF